MGCEYAHRHLHPASDHDLRLLALACAGAAVAQSFLQPQLNQGPLDGRYMMLHALSMPERRKRKLLQPVMVCMRQACIIVMKETQSKPGHVFRDP